MPETQIRISPVQEEEKLAEVLEFRSPHDRRWDSLDAADAPMVREALVHADILRQVGVHAVREASGNYTGDEYLMDFTARLAS
jgi:hypothetical protein